MAGGLVFTGGGSERVDCGSAAMLDDLATFSMIAWAYPTGTSHAANRQMVFKGSSSSRFLALSSAGAGSFVIFSSYSTTSGTARSSNSTYSANAWQVFAGTMDAPGGGTPHLYYSSGPTSALAEPSYAAGPTSPVGTIGSDASDNLLLGNANTFNRGFPGILGIAAIFNAVLSLANLEAIRQSPRFALTFSSCLGLWKLGEDGTGTQHDLTGNGNNGTVTGATAATDGYPTNWCID